MEHAQSQLRGKAASRPKCEERVQRRGWRPAEESSRTGEVRHHFNNYSVNVETAARDTLRLVQPLDGFFTYCDCLSSSPR